MAFIGPNEEGKEYKWLDLPVERLGFIESQFRIYQANNFYCGIAKHSGKVDHSVFNMSFRCHCLLMFRSSVITNFSLN